MIDPASCLGCEKPVMAGGHICDVCFSALVKGTADAEASWKRREKVWADVLGAEIAARKAAEAALQRLVKAEDELLHPQFQMLAKEINQANQTLDAFSVPRGEAIAGMSPDVHRSFSLDERIVFLLKREGLLM